MHPIMLTNAEVKVAFVAIYAAQMRMKAASKAYERGMTPAEIREAIDSLLEKLKGPATAAARQEENANA